jgi:hypothetical protein
MAALQLIMNEVLRMWKEAMMAYFKILSQHFPGETDESMKDVI